jgi:hypothetical protein
MQLHDIGIIKTHSYLAQRNQMSPVALQCRVLMCTLNHNLPVDENETLFPSTSSMPASSVLPGTLSHQRAVIKVQRINSTYLDSRHASAAREIAPSAARTVAVERYSRIGRLPVLVQVRLLAQ